MELLGGATKWAKVAFIIFLIGLALFLTSYGTRYWMQSESIDLNVVYAVGLWRIENCSGGYGAACSIYEVPSTYTNASFVVTQVFTSLILILLVAILVFFILYLVLESFREVAIAIGIAFACLCAVLLSIITMIVWLVQIPSLFYAGYSLGLFVFAFLLVLLAGLLLIPDIRTYGNTRGITQVRPETDDNDRYDEIKRNYYEGKRYKNGRHSINKNPLIRSPPPRYSTVAQPQYVIQPQQVYYPAPAWQPYRY